MIVIRVLMYLSRYSSRSTIYSSLLFTHYSKYPILLLLFTSTFISRLSLLYLLLTSKRDFSLDFSLDF